MDTLRGFALLGILPMNIVAFALPLAAYVTPMNDAVNVYRGAFAGAGALAWLVTHCLCELKMMTIFSMLFGAGLVLMAERADRRALAAGTEPRLAPVYYRRLGVLLLFGLFHGIVVWYGDILFYYALAGLLLYPLRRSSPRILVALGLLLFAAQLGLNRWEGRRVADARQLAAQAETAEDHGDELTPAQQSAEDDWEEIEEDHDPTTEQVKDEIQGARGSAASTWHRNWELVTYNYTSSELVFWFTRALASMLVGMGLMKISVFSASRSTGFYAAFVVVGYGVGFPLVGIGVWELWRRHFEPVYLELVGRQYNFVGSFFVALGHIGLVMLACRHRWTPWLARQLGAVGRMALTNYLAQSILCMALFSGWGLGLFARLTQAELWLVVASLWAAQIAYSSWWLARFRYGPAEWLWRSGTYASWQPLKASAGSS